jgi:hypothetical protein
MANNDTFSDYADIYNDKIEYLKIADPCSCDYDGYCSVIGQLKERIEKLR